MRPWFVLFFVLISSAILAQDDEQFQQFNRGEFHIIKNFLLKTRTGGEVCLSVVRLKAAPEKISSILTFDIYPEGEESSLEGSMWASRNLGYAIVDAQIRGKNCSSDDIEPFEHDGEDLYDIIDWISKQEWSDGKVAMAGGSYLGFTQWSALKNYHPALKTIIPEVSVGPGIDFPKMNGVFMSYMLRWLKFTTEGKFSIRAEFMDREKWNDLFAEWYRIGIKFAELDELEGHKNPIFQRWLEHPDYDDYWAAMIPNKETLAKLDLPILTITGYWDDDQIGAMYYFKEHTQANPKNNHYLILGPYSHSGYHENLLGLPINPVANFDRLKLVKEWLEFALEEGPRPELLENKINYFIQGEPTWRHCATLQEMKTSSKVFYLSSEKVNDFYKLSENPLLSHDSISLQVDFKNRNSLKIEGQDILAFPTLVPETLPDYEELIHFQTEPFENDMAIIGSLEANFEIIINKKDVDVVVFLYEQLADGRLVALSRNIQRASYSNDPKVRMLLTPNSSATVSLNNSYVMGKKIDKGSRIVALIGVNKSQHWEINYGTGKRVSLEDISDAEIPLEISWSNRSFIEIPVSVY